MATHEALQARLVLLRGGPLLAGGVDVARATEAVLARPLLHLPRHVVPPPTDVEVRDHVL